MWIALWTDRRAAWSGFNNREAPGGGHAMRISKTLHEQPMHSIGAFFEKIAK
jgi:hypothetical protein